MAAAPPLPTSFPCWCRAIYSWGGEKKQDLGFIEGDLIECLNAGDGSWWMGRLRRDKRMAGLFPSNFVEVLPDSAVPTMSSTPTPTTASGSRSDGSRSPSPKKSSGTRSWRKPFQAYAHASTPTSSSNNNQASAGGTGEGSVREKRSLRPYASMKTAKAPEGKEKSGRGGEDEAWIPAPVGRDGDTTAAEISRPSSRSRIPVSAAGRGHSGSISQGNNHGSVRMGDSTRNRMSFHASIGPGSVVRTNQGSAGTRDWNDDSHQQDNRQSSISRPRSSVGLYRPEESQYQQSHSNSALAVRPEYRVGGRQTSGISGISSTTSRPVGSFRGAPAIDRVSSRSSGLHHVRSKSEIRYDSSYDSYHDPPHGQGHGSNLNSSSAPKYGAPSWEHREGGHPARQPTGLGHARSRTDMGRYDGHEQDYSFHQTSNEHIQEQGHGHGHSYSQGGSYRDRHHPQTPSHAQSNSVSNPHQFSSLPGRDRDHAFPPDTTGGRFLLSGLNSLSRPGSAMGRPGSSMGGLSMSRPGSATGRPGSNTGRSYLNTSQAHPSVPFAPSPVAGLSHPARPGSSLARPSSAMGPTSRPGSSMGNHATGPIPHSAGIVPPPGFHSRQVLAPIRPGEMNELNGLRDRQAAAAMTDSFSQIQSRIAKFERGTGPVGHAPEELSPPPPPPPPHRHAGKHNAQPHRDHSPHHPAPGAPHTPNTHTDSRLTPSPLRTAMADVMSSLDEMGLGSTLQPSPDGINNDHDVSATPPIPWSPEEFDWRHGQQRGREFRPQSRAEQINQVRPMSSLGVRDAGFEIVSPDSGSPCRDRSPSRARTPSRPRADSNESRRNGSVCESEHPGSLTPGRRSRSNTVVSNTRLSRPKSSIGFGGLLSDLNNHPDTLLNEPRTIGRSSGSVSRSQTALANRKSAYELGRGMSFHQGPPGRTGSVSESASGSDAISVSGSQYSAAMHSLASGLSTGTGISATSAGSLARRRWTQSQPPSRAMANFPGRENGALNPGPMRGQMPPQQQIQRMTQTGAPTVTKPTVTGGLDGPTGGITYHNDPEPLLSASTISQDKRKTTAGGFLRRLLGGGRTIAASAREKTRNRSRSRPGSRLAGLVRKNESSPILSATESGISSATYNGTRPNSQAGHLLGAETDWIAVRRDVNRTNSISRNERSERADRCAMQDVPVIVPFDWLSGLEGDEGIDGLPVAEPADFGAASLALVDRTVRTMNVPWISLAGGNRGSVFGVPVPLPSITGFTTAQLCRPFRSEVQRLRAIFCFVAERVRWEPGADVSVQIAPESSDADLTRVFQTGRATSSEMARMVAAMCSAVGIHAVPVCGYLKRPAEPMSASELPAAADPVTGNLVLRPNHAWTAVLVGGEWRVIDCALASASNPLRPQFSSLDLAARPSDARPVASGGHSLIQKASMTSPVINPVNISASNGAGIAADPFWFLARPSFVLFTHVPVHSADQHVVPPLPSAVQLALPIACPAYFKHGLQLDKTFATSDTELLGLEVAHLKIRVPADVECVAEVRVPSLGTDMDGDRFETGDELCVAALCQADWIDDPETGRLEKWFTVKAVLPGDESGNSLASSGVLRVYAGKRGLMHSLRSNPHALAIAIGLRHLGGENPPLSFVVRHPTPQALRQDLYVSQPQCWKVKVGNTYVFAVRQSASDPYTYSGAVGSVPPSGPSFSTGRLARPASMASIATVSNAGSVFSVRSEDIASEQGSQIGQNANAPGGWKPAKLAIQSPGGKIIRLVRRMDFGGNTVGGPSGATGPVSTDGGYPSNYVGGTWETVIKVTERGTWRGLVLADRTARWCVWGEWECV